MLRAVTLSTGLTLSRIGLGCMGITAFYGESMPDDKAMELMSRVYAAGVRHFDTAEVYKVGSWEAHDQPGDVYNECIVGKFVATVPRESVTIATKFHPATELLPKTFGRHDCSLATVEAAVDGSLRRLGVSYIDLYYCHRMPKTTAELESFMHAAKALVAKGKIRYVGLSEPSPAQLELAHKIHPITAVQQEWSLATRVLEDTLVPVCRRLNIAIVAYSPLARNLLTLTKDARPPADWRASTVPRYQGENFEKNKEVAGAIAAMAATLHCTAAQLCLAWLYHRAAELGVTVIPIPGSTKVANALSNAASVDIKIPPAEYAALTELGTHIAGARGDERYLSAALEGQMHKSGN